MVKYSAKEVHTMSRGKQRDPCKEQFWRRLVARHDRSGLSVRAFCQLHDVSEPSFYAWRCTLRERDAQAVHFVPVELVADENAASATNGSAPLPTAGIRVSRLHPAVYGRHLGVRFCCAASSCLAQLSR